MRLLLADDEVELTSALKAVFAREKLTVDVVDNGDDALEYAMTGNYDGIVLDVMMPGKDGFEVLSRLRAAKNATPVMLLTARSAVGDRIRGLDEGADDYLPKPFDVGELTARVRAMLRRKGGYLPDDPAFQGVVLRRDNYELCYGEAAQRLGGREFQVMEMLMRSPHTIITTAQIMEHVWGWDSEAEVSVVWVNVSNLRKKLQAMGAPVEIRAVRGVGYALEKRS